MKHKQKFDTSSEQNTKQRSHNPTSIGKKDHNIRSPQHPYHWLRKIKNRLKSRKYLTQDQESQCEPIRQRQIQSDDASRRLMRRIDVHFYGELGTMRKYAVREEIAEEGDQVQCVLVKGRKEKIKQKGQVHEEDDNEDKDQNEGEEVQVAKLNKQEDNMQMDDHFDDSSVMQQEDHQNYR